MAANLCMPSMVPLENGARPQQCPGDTVLSVDSETLLTFGPAIENKIPTMCV